MRRRLSIGVSLVGDPRVIFLDEPTTYVRELQCSTMRARERERGSLGWLGNSGLDPETRRHLWDVMLEVKKGRCIILTTHSMEEAEVLTSRIGIVSKGRYCVHRHLERYATRSLTLFACLHRMRCLGPQVQLRNRFGGGYTLRINFDRMDASRATEYLQSLLPTAKLMEIYATTATYEVRRSELVISRLFQEMEQNKQNAGILDWGVSQTTYVAAFATRKHTFARSYSNLLRAVSCTAKARGCVFANRSRG